MTKILVENNGPLRGEVEVSGSKNAVLPILAAAILSEEETTIGDVPDLKDVTILCTLLSSLGLQIVHDKEKKSVTVNANEIISTHASDDLVQMMRASFLVMGPLLARKGSVTISLPGGCAIGERPIELHFKGLRKLGANIEFMENGHVKAVAEKLVGTDIYLDFPSVGATENVMIAATLAEGTTIIQNAAQEPEIIDLANFINKMGGKIKGAGTDTIKIEGVERLHGTKHNVIPDRIEAGTFMIAAAITRGSVLIKNVEPNHVKPIIAKLKECGVEIHMTDNGMIVRGDVNPLISTDIKTLPYPGFPTDMQSPFMSLLTTVKGQSIVIETVFENRFMHVLELNSMGARINIKDKCAIIEGNTKLHGAEVRATDLRAGAAVVLAGLVAEGTTVVSKIYHIKRGYENFVEKLQGLGAKISYIDSDEEEDE
ncbi:MAG: UDP-N-acetylglucosamine 1-carboxyvinyltransferase [Eubacteriales bacterium]|nr:UDP-N-acetylglucosamine 1-carboxyvinyltransferase [Eubacteriales bacterium]MDY3332920.1 UDP-N-acetylglucosamine 1-carboxyvinyltransferase [Gallibacter sp.]